MTSSGMSGLIQHECIGKLHVKQLNKNSVSTTRSSQIAHLCVSFSSIAENLLSDVEFEALSFPFSLKTTDLQPHFEARFLPDAILNRIFPQCLVENSF